MDQARVVVALVKIFEDTGEDFGLLRRQINTSISRFEELVPQRGGEEGRMGEDVFVRGEQALVRPNDHGHDSGGETWGNTI